MNNPHELNNEEKRLSRYASEQLGFKVMVFRDGNWICQPYDLRYNMGFGDTPDKAIADCMECNR